MKTREELAEEYWRTHDKLMFDSVRDAFLAGFSAAEERARGLVDALERIYIGDVSRGREYILQGDASKIAGKALEAYRRTT